jgi:hypothetical protein
MAATLHCLTGWVIGEIAGLMIGTALGLSTGITIAVAIIVDNAVMALIPGAMDSGLVNPIFWIGMIVALSAAFAAAFPVNRYLTDRGKGQALTHQYHEGHQGHGTEHHQGHGDHHAPAGASGDRPDVGDHHGHHH